MGVMVSGSFGDKLQLLLETRGWPRKRLASLLDVSLAYVSQLIAGTREKPSLEVVIAISKAFGVSMEWLMDLPEYQAAEWQLAPDEQYIVQLYRASPNQDVRRMMIESSRMQVKISGGIVPQPPEESSKQSSE